MQEKKYNGHCKTIDKYTNHTKHEPCDYRHIFGVIINTYLFCHVLCENLFLYLGIWNLRSSLVYVESSGREMSADTAAATEANCLKFVQNTSNGMSCVWLIR